MQERVPELVRVKVEEGVKHKDNEIAGLVDDLETSQDLAMNLNLYSDKKMEEIDEIKIFLREERCRHTAELSRANKEVADMKAQLLEANKEVSDMKAQLLVTVEKGNGGYNIFMDDEVKALVEGAKEYGNDWKKILEINKSIFADSRTAWSLQSKHGRLVDKGKATEPRVTVEKGNGGKNPFMDDEVKALVEGAKEYGNDWEKILEVNRSIFADSRTAQTLQSKHGRLVDKGEAK
jgi:hypothetical protein